MLDYIANNKEWIFSGIGVFLLSITVTLVISLIRRRNREASLQRQQSGSHSVNVQTHGDVTIEGSLNAGDQRETKSKER